MQYFLQMKFGDIIFYVVIFVIVFYGFGDMVFGFGQIKKCLYFDLDFKVCKKLYKQEKVI